MSNEIQVTPQASLRTGGAIQPVVPNNIEEVWRLAGIFFKSGMVPKALNTQEMVTAVLLQGQEVGLPGMAALQSIAMINGRLTIWGDGALGLVQGSGKLEWIKEWSEGEPMTDAYTAFCSVKRRNDPEVKTNSFSIAQAKKAKLWGKQGPWTDYPLRQIKMRPRSWSLRDGFSDVLKGIGITEEVMDIPPEQTEHTVVASEPAQPAREIKMPSVKPAVEVKAAPAPTVEHAPGMVYMDTVTKVTQRDTPQGVYYGIQTKAHGAGFLGTFDAKAAEIATAVANKEPIEIVYAIEGKYMKLVRIGPEAQQEQQADVVADSEQQEAAAE